MTIEPPLKINSAVGNPKRGDAAACAICGRAEAAHRTIITIASEDFRIGVLSPSLKDRGRMPRLEPSGRLLYYRATRVG